jgi:hypothetical protein
VTWPSERAPRGGDSWGPPAVATQAAVPVPSGRGRWRVTVHARRYTNVTRQSVLIAELASATGRRLEQNWNTPAQFTFTLDGHAAEAALVVELATDVIAWRWDEHYGRDRPMFYGIVDHAEDQVSEQNHAVTFTCHDYAAMLTRRYLTSTYTRTQFDQDTIADDLVYAAMSASSSSATSLSPGSWLPLTVNYANPDGTYRDVVANPSGQLRDRTYPPQTEIGTAFDELAKVINGFDYAVDPTADAALKIFYPYQGVTRNDLTLAYGSSVSAFTRTVNSGDYANYWRVLGNNGSADPAAAQLYAERWNGDANNVTQSPQGLWMSADNAADVSIQSTLDDRAAGNLALSGVVTPTYTLTLRPNWYTWGNPNLGDVVPLVAYVGRLKVNTAQRVLGITFDVNDDGDENVALTVGRPTANLLDLVTATTRDVNALTRR